MKYILCCHGNNALVPPAQVFLISRLQLDSASLFQIRGSLINLFISKLRIGMTAVFVCVYDVTDNLRNAPSHIVTIL